MIIDCQSHLFPPAYVDILARSRTSTWAERSTGGEFVIRYADVQEFKLNPESYDPMRKLRDMDRLGIDRAIVSCNMPGPCMLDPELGIAGATAINEGIAEVVAGRPDRFAGLACLPWQEPAAAVQVMERAKEDLKLCGVVLYSHIGGKPVDDPDFEPVYRRAAELGLPIVLHPTVPAWGAYVKEHSMIPMMGLQVDTSFALLRLVLSGMLERYPDLAVVMPHVGGVLPYMIGRIDHQTEVMGRGREHITRPPSDYLRRVFLDVVSPSAEALRFGYEFSGPDRLLFASDHPWVDPQIFLDLVRGMAIPQSEKDRILGGNALELFSLA